MVTRVDVNMHYHMMCIGIIILVLFATGQGFQHFQTRIPNGDRVPHPCIEDDLWSGVGHQNPSGGGKRNSFGIDFAKNDFVWDECLCRHDSDKDGRTNGQELGDPDCAWSPGMEPYSSSNLAHPGICEPMDTPNCGEMNGWLHCEALLPFHCPAFEAPGTMVAELRIDPYPIPEEETTYMCTAFDFPSTVLEGDFHMVGAEIIIDNVAILHHVLVYGCREEAYEQVYDLYGNTSECGSMVTRLCDQVIFVWGLGLGPECYGEEYGVRLGLNGFKTVVMEFHWNNPQHLSNEFDSSGVRVYYTPNIRQYDAETIFFGPVYLEIPPGDSYVVQEGICPTECTSKMFSETVYISSVFPHMHLTGKRMKVDLVRNGTVIRVLANDLEYDYNTPKRYEFNPAVAVHPGDEIFTSCVFDASDRQEYTFFGDATQDEMCVAIIQYYPVQANAGHCWTTDNTTTGFCDGDVWGQDTLGECYGIHRSGDLYQRFVHDEYSEYLQRLIENCDVNGLECYDGCQEVIEYVLKQRCFEEDVIGFFKDDTGPRIDRRGLLDANNNTRIFALTMASCSYAINKDTPITDGQSRSTILPGTCPFKDNPITSVPTPDSSSCLVANSMYIGVLVLSKAFLHCD